MHYGTVSESLEARVSLAVRNEIGVSETVEFTIDTGFSGEIALPQYVIDRLNLTREDDDATITLADGTIRVLAIYTGWIEWHGQDRDVIVVTLGVEPLLGMSVISGSNLSVDATPGGPVTIAELTGTAG